MARPVAIAIALMRFIMMPVMVAAMPLAMFSRPGRGGLILLPLSLRLALSPCRLRIWLTGTVMMRSVPALAIPLPAWAAVMKTPLALALRALELGLRSAETPDLFKFRLGILGRRALYRLGCCSVWLWLH